MTLAELRERVDHISEMWRDSPPAEQRTALAELDAALAELDDVETDSRSATEAVDDLRGRIEVLMDEIDIMLGIELPPIDTPDEYDDLLTAEQLAGDEDDMVTSVDDHRARNLIDAITGHLAAGSPPAVLGDDLEALDALDDDATPALKARLDGLRDALEQRMTAPDPSSAGRHSAVGVGESSGGRPGAEPS